MIKLTVKTNYTLKRLRKHWKAARWPERKRMLWLYIKHRCGVEGGTRIPWWLKPVWFCMFPVMFIRTRIDGLTKIYCLERDCYIINGVHISYEFMEEFTKLARNHPMCTYVQDDGIIVGFSITERLPGSKWAGNVKGKHGDE